MSRISLPRAFRLGAGGLAALGLVAAAATAVLAQTPAATPAPAPAPAAATPPDGFADCASCHAVTPGEGSLGPNLFGVVGRKAGSTDYAYSDAMKAASITWTPDQLQAFILDPAKTVPGNKMDYDGAKDADTAKSIVAYLATLK